MTWRLQRNRSAPSLADRATPPRQAAAAASAAATSAATAAAAAAAASAASAASAAPAASCKSFPKSRRSGVFLVEDVERPQADVGDFFLTESDLRRGGVPPPDFPGRPSGGGGGGAPPRRRHPDR